jgi:hypothetical protein
MPVPVAWMGADPQVDVCCPSQPAINVGAHLAWCPLPSANIHLVEVDSLSTQSRRDPAVRRSFSPSPTIVPIRTP